MEQSFCDSFAQVNCELWINNIWQGNGDFQVCIEPERGSGNTLLASKRKTGSRSVDKYRKFQEDYRI